MVEAEETYRNLSAKAHRLTTGGFSARWSPDSKKLAFSLGVHGYSGVAIFDPATKETDLLIVPGKDPRWSPDGKYIAFVRDRQNLRLEELLTPEPGKQQPPATDEEVWVMNADGTEPRRLAQGSWPSWDKDSVHLYYLSRGDSVLCSVSVTGLDTEPKRIMKCANALPSVSPDNQHVSYFEGGTLKIVDLTSHKSVAECRMPSMTWGVTGWSPSGREVCLGGGNPERDRTGLWLYDLDKKEFLNVLDGQIAATCWSPAGTELTFCLGTPYLEVWSLPLDPSVPTAEALGPGQTLDEHVREMLALYTRRIEADPQDAYAYSSRAQYHDYLRDRAKALADMRQWSAVLSGGSPRYSSSDTPRSSRRVVSLPFDCEFVFSAERPVNAIPMMSIAFGQKGRWEVKLFEIPIFVASLVGFCIISDLDLSPAYADFAFGHPAELETVIPVLDPAHDAIDCFSSDGLEMYVESDRPGGLGGFDIWVSRRATTDSRWGPLENLGSAVNSARDENTCSISTDGLTFYYSSDRPGGYGDADIWMAKRESSGALWRPGTNLGPKINSPAMEGSPRVSPDGLELYFASWRSGGYGSGDIYVAKRAAADDPWSDAVNLGPGVNSPYGETNPTLSPDGLLLLFSDRYVSPFRPGGCGGGDMWMTRRASISSPWQPPVNLGAKVNSAGLDVTGCMAHDGLASYMWTLRDGTWEGWQVPIIPIVDFNGDGQVDGKDLVAMVVQWGGNDPVCDIGPYAWGDGVVDVEDLKVLAEYISKEVVDGTLIAHWKLDETEGMTAEDSAGDSDGTVMDGATWRPNGGKVDGALEFDGVDDFVLADLPTGLGDGPFSVCAWVKGGAPGEAVISQRDRADWLLANPTDGSLMTKLVNGGQPLMHGYSDVVITDGQWHRIVLAWDGANRMLYVDDMQVAADAVAELDITSASLIIGCGARTAPDSFWSGLIDDVRIYNRAVRP